MIKKLSLISGGLIIFYALNAYGEEHHKASIPDYSKLLEDCKTECCRISAREMKLKNALLRSNDEICPSGYTPNMLKCIDSYQWCEVSEIEEKESGNNNSLKSQ